MADLRSVAELAWRQLFPNPTDETPISKEEFIETAKLEYAHQAWLYALEEKNREGYINVSSILLIESEPLAVINNEIDISGLDILKSLPHETWLQGIGGDDCDCNYVKTTRNQYQTLCDDDSLSDYDKLFYVLGKKIKFPIGAHSDKVSIVYASNGKNLDDSIEVEDSIAGIVRARLIDIYVGKTGKEDSTNNSSSNS